MSSSVLITTDRLILRAPRMDDAEPLMAVFGDAEAMRYVNHGKTRSIEQVRESIQKRIDCLAANGFTLWTVVVADSGEIIGDCGAIPIAWQGPEFELAYRLTPSAWGKGYATEAGRAAMASTWANTTLDHLVAVTAPGNLASQRVLVKLGFADQGETTAYYNGERLRGFAVTRPANDPA